MNAKLKIGIVEDDMIIADAISEMLLSIGYEVTEPAVHYTAALEMIETEKPDLLLLDITLMGKKDGIDVAKEVRKKINIPFIFLTANMDSSTVERAKEVLPLAYLAKPITREQLYSAIEIAFLNFNSNTTPVNPLHSSTVNIPDSIFVKEGYAFRKVLFENIVFIMSDANYVNIHLADGNKIITRYKLDDFILLLDKQVFLRVHRSYAVHRKKIERVFPMAISMGSIKIPLGKTYKEDIFQALGIKP
jgi:DNA-binding LytR/AlgR family response regulator